jgi:mannosyltransferase
MTRTNSFTARVWRILPLLLILVLAAILRVRGIGRDSLWGDEALTWILARMSLPELIRHATWWEQIPPLHHLIVKAWMGVFGDSEASLRMPSALAGIASVYMLYALVAKLMGRRVALMSALLLAVSPMHIAYSQECRTYALHVLLGLICCDVFVRLLRRPTPTLHAAYAISAALFMYSHPYAAFTLAALHAFYLLRRRRPRRVRRMPLSFKSLLIDDLAALALFSPWLPVIARWMGQVQPTIWLSRVTLDDISRTLWFFSGQTAMLCVMVALLVIAVWRWRRREGFWLLLLIALTPVVVPVVICLLIGPAFVPRYAIMGVSGFVAVAAAGVAALRPAPLRLAALLAIAIASPFGDAADIVRPDWRQIGEYLTRNMRAGDLAVIEIRAGTRLYDYYVRSRPDVRRLGIDTINLPVSYPLEPPGRHVWLVIYHEWHATAAMIRRAPVTIGRRKFTWGVLAMELLEDPDRLPHTSTSTTTTMPTTMPINAS